MIMVIAGALRSDELVKLTIDDIQDLGSTILVSVMNTKNYVNRTFTIVSKENCSIDFVSICKKYMALRKETTEHRRFFVGYRNNKCSTQPVGKNTFGELPRKIASFLKFPDISSYTGHCFRRSSTSLLADTGADISVLKRHGGWKSTTVAEGYVKNSLANKKMIAQKILMGIDSEKENWPSVSNSLHQVDISVPIHNNTSTNRLKSVFNISGGSNINININMK
jgi:integrase